MANQLEPGLSKWRGQLLFEMQSSNVVLAQRALDESKITSFQAKVHASHQIYMKLFSNALSMKHGLASVF